MLDGIKREQVAKTIGCTTESLRRCWLPSPVLRRRMMRDPRIVE